MPLIRANLARGFTLIEMMITLAVVGVVLGLGAPSFFAWIQNTQIRSATDSMLTGIKLARAEALKRNAPAYFQMVTSTDSSCALSTSGTSWVVSGAPAAGLCASTDPAIIVRVKPGGEGTANAVYSSSTVGFDGSIAFDALGRVTPALAGDVVINVTNPTGGDCVAAAGTMRCLRIIVGAGGQARMCDPAVATDATDPRSC